jgi:hypothetical protein
MQPEQDLSRLFTQEKQIRHEQLVSLELARRLEFNYRFGQYLRKFRQLQNIPIKEIKPEEFSKFGYESIIVYPDLQGIIEVCDFKIAEADRVVDQNEANLVFSILGDLSRFCLSLRMFNLLTNTLERSKMERDFDQNILEPLDIPTNSNAIEMTFVTPSFPEVMNKFLEHPKYFENNKD